MTPNFVVVVSVLLLIYRHIGWGRHLPLQSRFKAFCGSIHRNVEAQINHTQLRSQVGNVSGCRYVSDCRSRGRDFDPDPVPFLRVD